MCKSGGTMRQWVNYAAEKTTVDRESVDTTVRDGSGDLKFVHNE